MLAMDQGVVEEWLSEFKVRDCLCPSKEISEQANEFAVFLPLTCVCYRPFLTVPYPATPPP